MNEMFFTVCRNIGDRFPNLRERLLPAWGAFHHVRWVLRNVFSRNRPIEYQMKRNSICMLPEGHIAEVMWMGGFENNERDFVENFLKPGMCVLNIGANAGLYTLMAAKLVGPKGVVHAFEPATMNFDRLRRNVALNGLSNVHSNQYAVSDSNGTLAVLRDPSHPKLDSHFSVGGVTGGKLPVDAIELIPCVTIDSYWRNVCQGDLDRVDMIIIDVEGAELSVFKGAKALFAASPNLVMMAECTERLAELDVLLRAQGFSFNLWNASAACLEETTMKRGTIYAVKTHQVSNT